MIVIVSQMLLISLALAWGVYLVVIASDGGVLSIENNPLILYGEILATCLIIQFALIVIGTEVYRMRAQRRGERTTSQPPVILNTPEPAVHEAESSHAGSTISANSPDALSEYRINN